MPDETVLERFITEFDFRTNRFNLRGIENEIDGAVRRINTSVGRVAAFTAVIGSALAGGAIVAGLTASTKKAIEWESSFTGVRKTVDATEAQFASLERELLAMSAIDVPIDPHQLAEVAEAAGQLGIHTRNIESFTETMSQLGVTTNLSAQEAATSLARFANVTGMSQSMFDRLGSTIVHLGNNFATTEAEIVNMASRMAGTGTTIGLTQPEILGFATALSSVGIQAELGGTAFSRIAGEMQKAVEVGGEALVGFADIAGMSAAAFARLFGDAPAKALEQFIGGVRRMRDEGQAVLEPLEALGFSGVRVRETILKSATAFELMQDAVGGAGQAWEENTALQTEADLRFSTTASKIDFLSNAIERLGIVLAQQTGTTGIFGRAIDSITGAINRMADAIDEVDPVLVNPGVAPLGQTGAGGRRRRRGQAAPPVDLGQWFMDVLGVTPAAAPPPGLSPAAVRQWRRDQQRQAGRSLQQSGFAAAIGAEFDTSFKVPEAATPDETESERQTRIARMRQAAFAGEQPTAAPWELSVRDSINREISRMLRGDAFGGAGIAGGKFGQSGLDEFLDNMEADTDAMLDRTFGNMLDELEEELAPVRANVLGLGVTLGDTGLDIDLIGTRSERWSQGLADLGGVMLDTIGRTSRFAGTLLSVVQGAVSGGPLGALAAGFSALVPSLFESATGARQAARALREKAIAQEAELRGMTASVLLQARLQADPERESQAQAELFGQIAEFLQGMDAPSLFGEYGALEQILNTLGLFDRHGVDELADVQPTGAPGEPFGIAGPLGPALFKLLDGFRSLFGPDATWVDVIEHFVDSDVFQRIFGLGREPTTTAPFTTNDPDLQRSINEGFNGFAADATPSFTAATPPPSLAGGSTSIHVDIGEITVAVAEGDPQTIGEGLADQIENVLIEKLNNVAEDFDTDINR